MLWRLFFRAHVRGFFWGPEAAQGYLLQLEGHLRLQLRIELEQAEVQGFGER